MSMYSVVAVEICFISDSRMHLDCRPNRLWKKHAPHCCVVSSLLYRAMIGEEYKHLIREALDFEIEMLGGRSLDAAGNPSYLTVADVLAVKVGSEFLKEIPGHVSTEVSFII